MKNFIKKLNVHDISLIKAFLGGLVSVLIYSLLLIFIQISGVAINVVMMMTAMVGITASVQYSMIIDKQIIGINNYKASSEGNILLFCNLISFWYLMWWLCSNINISVFASNIITLTCVFSFIRLILAIVAKKKLMKIIKELKTIKEKSDSNMLINDSIKKQSCSFVILGFVPNIIYFVFFVWGFYFIFSAINMSPALISFIIVVILFIAISSNISGILTKDLFNKVIESNDE